MVETGCTGGRNGLYGKKLRVFDGHDKLQRVVRVFWPVPLTYNPFLPCVQPVLATRGSRSPNTYNFGNRQGTATGTGTRTFVVGTGTAPVPIPRQVYPIAYESHKLIPAEVNYTVTEKRMLTSVHALKVWRCYLEGNRFTLVTDHRPNIFVQSQGLPSQRRARWCEILQRFNFDWEYRPGRDNVADPLSRIPGLHLLALGRRGSRPRTSLSSHPLPGPSSPTPGQRSIGTATLTSQLLAESVNSAELQERLKSGELSQSQDGLLYHGDQIAIPGPVRQEIIKQYYDSPWSGHFGQHKTLHLVSRHFWWPGMSQDVKSYVQSCDACQRNKHRQVKPSGLLVPLEVATEPWATVTVDFVTDLPRTVMNASLLVLSIQ